MKETKDYSRECDHCKKSLDNSEYVICTECESVICLECCTKELAYNEAIVFDDHIDSKTCPICTNKNKEDK